MANKTPLFAWHEQAGARIVDFGGWDMPVVYTSIVEEHHATRTAAGLFDISHMGRVRFDGPDRVRFLDHLLTNRVDNLKPGQVRYSLVLNESAGTLDDVLVYRLETYHLVVVNASNREKLLAWFRNHQAGYDVTITDMTAEWIMIACQGPKALRLAQPLLPLDPASLKYYFAGETSYEGAYAIASRTGYTGEDGVELIVPADRAGGLWTRLLEAGASDGVRPVGLGARDTLRLEAGMPLYGHELDETIDPVQAGLDWAVKSDAKDFIGKAALARRDPARPVRVGLMLPDKRIARDGYPIQAGACVVGRVTSGTFAPTLAKAIAMGYVTPDQATAGAELAVVIRERPVPAQVVSLPFYKREKV